MYLNVPTPCALIPSRELPSNDDPTEPLARSTPFQGQRLYSPLPQPNSSSLSGNRAIKVWILYQIGMASALLLAAPFLLLGHSRHYLPTLSGRLARGRAASKPHSLWIHAVSVGEVGVATTLIRALPEELSVLITTVTPTGQERARESLSARATVAYLPFDLGFALRRFFSRFRPESLILVEGELWPLLLRFASRRGLEVSLINGRISDDSFRRMRRLRPLLGVLLSKISLFAVQTDRDRDRFLKLGVCANRVAVTGNLKYDSPEPERNVELERYIGELAHGRSVLVAGSTMEGEEDHVLDAFSRLGGDRALLVLAPRHPERFDSAAEAIRRRSLTLKRRSRLAGEATTALDSSVDRERAEVLLLDSLGELSGIYRLADAAFIGGTLVPTGGHNPLEPARFGAPIVIGPSMENFLEIADQFDRQAAWQRIQDSSGLARTWERWLDEPSAAQAFGERGKKLFELNGGALEKTLDLLRPVLSNDTRARPTA